MADIASLLKSLKLFKKKYFRHFKITKVTYVYSSTTLHTVV